jgi:hypothetical protein
MKKTGADWMVKRSAGSGLTELQWGLRSKLHHPRNADGSTSTPSAFRFSVAVSVSNDTLAFRIETGCTDAAPHLQRISDMDFRRRRSRSFWSIFSTHRAYA